MAVFQVNLGQPVSCPSVLVLHMFWKRIFWDEWHRLFTVQMSFLTPNQDLEETVS